MFALDMAFAVRQRSARANGDMRVTAASTNVRMFTGARADVRPPMH